MCKTEYKDLSKRTVRTICGGGKNGAIAYTFLRTVADELGVVVIFTGIKR